MPSRMSSPWCDTLLAERKAEARREALALRARCQPPQGLWLAAQVLAQAPPLPGAVVAGFWPMSGEIDLRPLLLALQGRGHALALPVTPRRGQPLGFRRWGFGQALVAGPFGTRQPAADATLITPDFILVPLLGFDSHGRRLGYGGGYYDRTLALLPRAQALGVAFAAQQRVDLPAGPHDVRLPRVATERGIINCEAS